MVKIAFLEEFKRQAKAFKKKYKSFGDDFEALLYSIKEKSPRFPRSMNS